MHWIQQLLAAMSATLAAWGPWGVFLLAFIDSAGIPVSLGMDALIILLGAKAPESVWLGASLAVVGSMIGNFILFWLARKGGGRFVSQTIQPGRTAKFREWFRRYGLLTVFIPALLPIPLPLKVFVITAGMLHHTSVISFLLVVLAARVIRYFGEAWLGLVVGERSVSFLAENVVALIGAAAVLFGVIYAVLHLHERRRMRS